MHRRRFLAATGAVTLTMPGFLSACGKSGSGPELAAAPPADPFAEWFGIEAAPFDGIVRPLEEQMAGDAGLWREIATREGLAAEVSLRNSPGVMGWPSVPSDWVRPGIMLYGATPFDQPQSVADRLQPVMTLESKVICVRELPAGEPVGYGGAFVTDRNMRIGVVAMGYADGYPRQAPTGTPVMIDGQCSQLLGRVSMDMLCVDLTNVPGAGLGSRVELWGKSVLASDVAASAGTIPYQIFCNLKRVPRLYSGA